MKREREPDAALDWELYPHQQVGVQRILAGFCNVLVQTKTGMAPASCFLLHDDMGLGKTRQALAAVHRMMETDRLAAFPATPVLILAPASCLHVWEQEIGTKFKDVRVFVGDTATERTLRDITHQTVLITSYCTLRGAYGGFLGTHLAMGSMTNAELVRVCLSDGNGTSPAQLRAWFDEGNRAQLLAVARQTRGSGEAHHHLKNMAKLAGYERLIRLDYSIVVMDEIHTIKNSGSKSCKAAAFVSARYRLGLSGTPTMNHGGEMLTILKYGLGLYNVDWAQIYRDPNGPYCHALLAVVCFGRRKIDVPELAHLLPARDEAAIEQVHVPWTGYDEGKQLYIAIRTQSLGALDEIHQLRQFLGETRENFNVRRSRVTQNFWSMFQQLRQVCLHPWLVLREPVNGSIPHQFVYRPDTAFAFPLWLQQKCHVANLCMVRHQLPAFVRERVQGYLVNAERYEIQPSPKMLQFLDICRARPTHKIVAVSQFRQFLGQIMVPWLSRNGITCALFAGGSRQQQTLVLEQFDNNPELRVLLVVKSAGAHGINLQHASATIVIMEPHFNDALDEQASQRVDRLGQREKRVMIRKLYMEGSVDVALRTMQTKKTEQTNAWMGRNENPLSLESVGLFLSTEDAVGK